MFKSGSISLFWNKLPRILWGLTLLTLPVTSFRWFPFLSDDTLVRPLSLYPLIFLLPVLFIKGIRREINLQWAGSFIALGAFILFILFSSSYGFLLDPLPLRGQIYLGRSIRALVTLVAGLAFFISAVWMNRDEADFRFTAQWILAGLCLDLAWIGLQAVTFYTKLLNKEMVTHWQLAFSMRELVRTNRISGLAYEPAWLAGQLATIYIPILFSSILTGYRLTRLKWLEPVLLALSTLALLATYSRGGLLVALAAAGLTFLFFGREIMLSSWRWFIHGFRSAFSDILIRVGILVIIAGIFSGALFFLNQKGYFRRLWNFNAQSFSDYLVNISVGARGAYSSGAYGAYEEHPLTGVGLGASGFYIYQHLPDWSQTTLPEIARQLSPESHLYPNPKNLYVRLLAETGLIGFILFLAFEFHVLGDTLAFLRSGEQWFRFAAIVGVFAWLGVAFYNFTQDSLTIPNIWLVSGVIVGLAANLGQGVADQFEEEIK